MNIETKWLEDFLSLATTQNFSRSAGERHLTQPAFSRRIQSLEAAIGCELIDRSCVPVQLTAEGRLFQETAKNLISQLDSCVSHIRSLNTKGQSVIDFAVSHALSLSLFPPFIQSLQGETECNVRQLVANADECVQALKNGISDFIFAFEEHSLHVDSFDILRLQTEQLIPICGVNKAGEALFDLDDDAQCRFPYLSYPKDIYLGRCVRQLIKKPHRTIKLEQAFESTMADSLKGMALQGSGIAWVPSFSVSDELAKKQLVICGGEVWQMPLNICVYRHQRQLSSSAEELWSLLQQRYAATDDEMWES